jgi:hypothetical protein
MIFRAQISIFYPGANNPTIMSYNRSAVEFTTQQIAQEPILRLLNLQLQCQRFNRRDRFLK